MPSYKHLKKEVVLQAIENSQGIFSTIAKRLGCKSDTAERLCHRWNETEQALKNETNFVLDLAESKVIKAISDGDIKTCKWYLTLKGQERGYIVTPTLKLENAEPLNINFSGISKEELENAPNVEVNNGEAKAETED